MLQKPDALRTGIVKGSRYSKYSFTLDALPPNASGFCNIGVYSGDEG
jgi:hypothetical protein